MFRGISGAPPPLFVLGSTASGKSAVAAALARMIGGEVVNADAFQLYRGMPITTAQPTASEVAQAPHHLSRHSTRRRIPPHAMRRWRSRSSPKSPPRGGPPSWWAAAVSM
ncbi:MAG: isopentenyl transferase family protein [Verrucomicrobiales bacterium]